MSNIAEGFESGTNKQFINFLYTSKGSNGEVRSQAYVEYLKHTLFDGPKFRESGPVWHVNEPET